MENFSELYRHLVEKNKLIILDSLNFLILILPGVAVVPKEFKTFTVSFMYVFVIIINIYLTLKILMQMVYVLIEETCLA